MLKQVLVVDDHFAVRSGVARMLEESFPGVRVGIADAVQRSLEMVAAETWDLVILDLSLPGRGGLDVIRQIKDISPSTGILIYTMYPEDQFGVRSMRAGADGYVTKDRPEAELREAAQRVASGKRYISPLLAESLANYVAEPSAGNRHELLSDREFQILQLFASGKTPTDVAAELSLSIKTVSTYRARMLVKLNLNTTAELIRYAVQQKLVP
jgi:DNA-binding NarL/FixJ family response regulator